MATEKLVGNLLIAQSGGPTVVINQSLVGAVLEAKKHKEIKKIFGSLHGLKGILDENLCDLGKETKANLELVAQTPSSALGSVRKKPTPEDCVKVFQVLRKYNIRYFFYIGGNDSAETTHIINEAALQAKYEMKCFHICKTIDNDLRENDHTPGFGSAAKFVAQAFMGDNLDNRSLPGVKINVIMGRHAGFLTAAAALARVHPGDGPHLIYLPERPFVMEKFLADVKAVFEKTNAASSPSAKALATKPVSPSPPSSARKSIRTATSNSAAPAPSAIFWPTPSAKPKSPRASAPTRLAISSGRSSALFPPTTRRKRASSARWR